MIKASYIFNIIKLFNGLPDFGLRYSVYYKLYRQPMCVITGGDKLLEGNWR